MKKQDLIIGEEYSVLEVGMNEFWDNMKYLGYNQMQDEHTFYNNEIACSGSNEVYILTVGDKGLNTTVRM